jgi:hypothetical protein
MMSSLASHASGTLDALGHSLRGETGGQIRQLVNHDVRTCEGDGTCQRGRVEGVDDNGVNPHSPQGFRLGRRARSSDYVVVRLKEQWDQALPDRTRRSGKKYLHVSSMREAGIPALSVPQ